MNKHELLNKLLEYARQNREGFSVYVDEMGDFYPIKNKLWYIVSEKTIITINKTNDVRFHSSDVGKGYYGGWLDKDTNMYFIEKNRVFLSRKRAIAFGVEHSQKAIWDAFNGKEIFLENECIDTAFDDFGLVVQQKWNRNKRRYLRWNEAPKNWELKISKDSIDCSLNGYYDFVTGDICLSWLGLKVTANNTGANVIDLIVGVISHESIHYWIHKEEGIEATVLFDGCGRAGIASAFTDTLYAGMSLIKERFME